MKPTRQWLLYSLLRAGIFAVVLAALLLLQLTPWIAAVIAAVVGLCVTSLFFRPQRDAVARSFYEFRTSEHRDADSDLENDVLDGRDSSRTSPQAGSQPAAQPAEPRVIDHRDRGVDHRD